MLISTMHKKDVARYVEDMLQDFETGLRSIMITIPVKSEDSSALTVIGISSEDTEDYTVRSFSGKLTNILIENTPAG